LGGRGSAPDPTGRAHSAPLDPLAGGEGAGCPSSRTPPPLSALRASGCGPPRALLNQYPRMKKSKSGHPIVK